MNYKHIFAQAIDLDLQVETRIDAGAVHDVQSSGHEASIQGACIAP